MKHHPQSTSSPLRSILTLGLALGVLALSASPGRSATLISCTGNPGGDWYDRGFYIPSYPGTTLDSARLEFSTPTLGTYSVTMTVTEDRFGGRVIGTSTRNIVLSGSNPQNLPVTFTFGSAAVDPGSRVCFAMTLNSGPSALLAYSVPNFSDGCSEVVQTEGTTPPLSSFRRHGVNLVVTGTPWLTVPPGFSIQAAINRAAPGDTVRVEPGTYIEDLTLRSEVSVAGAGYGATILRGTGSNTVVLANNVTNAQFEGFTIANSGAASGQAGVEIRGGNVLFSNNRITENLNGVRVQSGSSAILRNNLIEGNGSAGNAVLDYGVIVLSSTPLIANNVIVNNVGTGIYVAWAASAGAQIVNNTVSGNTDNGVWCYNGANAIVKNNIFTRNATGISASHGALPQISFNNVWNNSWRNYDSQSGGVASAGLGDLSADPLFDPASTPPYTLLAGSPSIDAGDPNPLYNDRDGSRNDQGAFGGPSSLLSGIARPVASGFLFNNIGKIPTSEITRTGPQAGLANVAPSVASALHIYPYQDAPFGGNLWLHGLFGTADSLVQYYRIDAARWTGSTPPAPADFAPQSNPLSKIKYTVNPSGTVSAALESVGPDANGLYLRTDRPDSGYWAHPDLKLIWNTRGMPDGKYDLICKGYWMFLGTPIEVTLPANELSRITVVVNNQQVTATIDAVRNRAGSVIPECGLIPVLTDREEIQFQITASHPGGFLRDYALTALYGRNRNGGVITRDQYAGAHDSAPPLWSGVTGYVTNSVASHASGELAPWTPCAYQFRLQAWARTTDGFHHIYQKTFNDHYFINLGGGFTSGCAGDLDNDGDVDGADLVIFASQFGRTNCVAAPVAP